MTLAHLASIAASVALILLALVVMVDSALAAKRRETL